MLISLPVQNGRHLKKSYFSHLTDFSAMAPYPIFFRALKTIIMPNFMLLTESEQFISALLFVKCRRCAIVHPLVGTHDCLVTRNYIITRKKAPNILISKHLRALFLKRPTCSSRDMRNCTHKVDA